MPFAGTRVIPRGWSAHHARSLASAANGTCWVRDPTRNTPGALDPETGVRGPDTPHAVAGTAEQPIPCRIQAVTSARETGQTGQVSTERGYLVQLVDVDLNLPDIEEGHVVRVVSARNDPNLVGLDLHVDDVQHGTERFTRDLVTSHNQQPNV